MQNHDDKIQPNPNRLRVGARVHVRDPRLPNAERKEGRIVSHRAACVQLPPVVVDSAAAIEGAPVATAQVFVVLCIVVFSDGNAMAFAESELEPRSEESRIVKPGRIQPASIIRR